MQNSLERLLTGTARSLRDTVAPTLTDEYALAQLRAASEILDNIASRVDWRADLFAEPRAEIAALVAGGLDAAPAEALARGRAWLVQPSGGTTDVADWFAALDALAELQEWLAEDRTRAPELAARVRAFVAADVQAESNRLRTGMYRSDVP